MELNLQAELAQLERLSVGQLRQRYGEVFGELTRAGHRVWLIKRIAWRLQALAHGDLSERAKKRAAELANDADLRTTPPKSMAVDIAPGTPLAGNNRLPPSGSVITRVYKGRRLEVKVLDDGFEFEGQAYASLSAVAKAITGSHCNGFWFFKLGQKGA